MALWHKSLLNCHQLRIWPKRFFWADNKTLEVLAFKMMKHDWKQKQREFFRCYRKKHGHNNWVIRVIECCQEFIDVIAAWKKMWRQQQQQRLQSALLMHCWDIFGFSKELIFSIRNFILMRLDNRHFDCTLYSARLSRKLRLKKRGIAKITRPTVPMWNQSTLEPLRCPRLLLL